MTSLRINIQQKSQSLLNNNLILAIIIHLIFIFFVNVHFNITPPKKTTNISFLGAILDPFETDRIKTQNYLSTNNTLTLPTNNHQHNKNTATALTKPRFSQSFYKNHKTLFKSPPEKEKISPKSFQNKTMTTDEYHFIPQPYQRLQLYP